MAQQNQNIIAQINQIQQLLNHGVQDINQVLPLLPPILQHFQLQDQRIQNLQAALAGAQANTNNLNNLINANQQVIAQLELDRNNLENELARRQRELDEFQRVNERIIEDILRRIIERFRNELNLNRNDTIAQLNPRFNNLEALLNRHRNDIIANIEDHTNPLRNLLNDHTNRLENIINAITVMQGNINRLLLEFNNCREINQERHNELLGHHGMLRQQYIDFNNNNIRNRHNLLNQINAQLNNSVNQIRANIANSSLILDANIAQNLNAELANAVNRLTLIIGNNRIINNPQNMPPFNYAIPIYIWNPFFNILNVILRFVENRPLICFTIITLFISVYLCYF